MLKYPNESNLRRKGSVAPRGQSIIVTVHHGRKVTVAGVQRQLVTEHLPSGSGELNK